MDLLCYLSFYPVALAGGAARCASTVAEPVPLTIGRWKNSQSSIVHWFGLTGEALSGRPSGALKNLGCQSRRQVSRDFSVATETVAFGVWALTSLVLSGSSQKERIRSWIKNPHGLNKPQGFPLFEIPRSPFARLRAEHKLYITLLLILTPLVHLRRVLAYSFHSLP